MSVDVLDRLTAHKSALDAFGIGSLSELPPMEIGGRVLVSPSGLTSPRIGSLYGADGRVRASHVPDSSQPSGWREVRDLPVRQLRAEAPGRQLSLTSSYWAAREIRLLPGTTVVLPHPLAHLTVLTERMVVGPDVTFTWQRPDLPTPGDLPPPRRRPDRPAQAPDGTWGLDGERGADGRPGSRGHDGGAAPQLELWALELVGTPAFDVRGQDGGQGGRGQDGGIGGRGARGRPSRSTYVDCREGPGFGGRGGDGGRGGPGGTGGNGGGGGEVRLYLPAEVLSEFTAGGFLVLEAGGAGGPGGRPGSGGGWGLGGDPGEARGRCRPDPDRRGHPGHPGGPGDTGPSGHPGAARHRAVRLSSVDTAEFRKKLTAPAVVGLEPRTVRVGDSVTLTGQRLQDDDELLINGEVTAHESFGDSMLRFTVPLTWGGNAQVRIRQVDGTLSNPDNLLVLPTLDRAQPAERVVPGSRVVLTGTGFAVQARVTGNGQDMPDAVVTAPDRLEVTVVRPFEVVRNAIAEEVRLSVVLPTGQGSNALSVALDTYRVAVVGDSVAWGQGLEDHERASQVVGQRLEAADAAGRGVYVHSRAHSGAVIGVGNATVLPPVHGEVPTAFPTVLQQVEAFDGEDERGVDLVLLSAGINDIDFRAIISPLTDRDDLLARIDRHCREDMGVLLARTMERFGHAKIIVTGYFPFLSKDSNLGLVEPLLAAMGMFTGQGLLTSALLWERLDTVLEHCWLFYERSSQALQQAVDAANAQLSASGTARRVAFANPAFAPANAALAPSSWLFGVSFLNGPAGLLPAPADSPSVSRPRAVVCEQVGEGRTNVWVCKLASAGHPNVQGAQQYALAILEALDRLAAPDGEPSSPTTPPPTPQVVQQRVAPQGAGRSAPGDG